MDHLADQQLPGGFFEARDLIRRALDQCQHQRLPHDAVLAVLLSELMPRLVETYGPLGVAAVLDQIGQSLGNSSSSPQLKQ